MALLDRVNLRVEHDLDDAEVQLLVDEANLAIVDRFGPHANPSAPITVQLDSDGRRTLDLIRPIDTTHPVVVVDTPRWDPDGAVTLVDADYQISNGGRTLVRRGWPGATSSSGITLDRDGRRAFGDSVSITYVPVDDGNQRQEVIIGLVQLAIERRGVKRRKAGDLETDSSDYTAEREKLLASLSPRRGLFVR